jgi:hypothetical protein
VDEDRFYSVEPDQGGTGYFVTRHDVNGTFTTQTGAQHPGCTDAGLFVGAPETGRWNGIWTQQITGNFDYDPDATMPADPSWDNFINAFFADDDGGPAPTVTFISYEFDYYLPCNGSHWRDASYAPPTGDSQEGTIGLSLNACAWAPAGSIPGRPPRRIYTGRSAACAASTSRPIWSINIEGGVSSFMAARPAGHEGEGHPALQ